MPEPGELTDHQLLRSIDRKLDRHLVRCESCRDEVCELSQIVRGNGRPGLVSQIRLLMAAAGLIGLVVVGVVVELFRSWWTL